MVAVLGAPSSSEAKAKKKPPFVTQPVPKLRAAAQGAKTILVSARTKSGATCRTNVSVKKVSQTLAKVKATKKGRASWRWQILPTSPSGTWRFKVTCTKGKAKGVATRRVLVVTGNKTGKGPIGDPASLANPDGEIAGLGGDDCGPFNSPPLKQCTCLAWQKRRDVYDTSVARGVPSGGGRGGGYYVWDGGQWLVNARRGGFPTGSQPVAGALVVWGVPNSASYGHVAYVERVESPSRVIVTECNYDWKGSCRTIPMNPAAITNFQGYIYGGPSGSGLGGTGTSPAPTFSDAGGIISGSGAALVKGGAGKAFQPQTGPDDAKAIALSGPRIGVVTANGTALVKRDSGQGFEAQTGAADALDLALGGSRIGVVSANGTALVKRDFGQPFEAQTGQGDARAIALSGTRVGVITANGTAMVKRDLGQPFEAVTAPGDATAIALSGSRVGVITANGTALVSPDLGQPFQAQTGAGDALDIALGGNRIGVVTANGTALVKSDLGQPFQAQTSAGDARAIALPTD
ncbi:CHAP domain-containing protein [Patulibacter sp. NPDC049589]|uniref:CHAP domain-containing protein n=1 Tax=Patulibacter sp. NPDC049589 TaxID=3154731 RepID=UPI0034194594